MLLVITWGIFVSILMELGFPMEKGGGRGERVVGCDVGAISIQGSCRCLGKERCCGIETPRCVFVTAGCGFHDGDVLLGYLAGRFHETVKEGAVVVARLVFGIVSSTHVKGCW